MARKSQMHDQLWTEEVHGLYEGWTKIHHLHSSLIQLFTVIILGKDFIIAYVSSCDKDAVEIISIGCP